MKERNLRAIALCHRGQLVSVFLVLGFGLLTAISRQDPDTLPLPAFLSTTVLYDLFGVSLFALLAFSAALIWYMYSGAELVIAWVLSLVPGLDLLAWLFIHFHATRVLRAAGATVGLLGASPSSLPSPVIRT
jgi:tryptophan-rich sensory protein